MPLPVFSTFKAPILLTKYKQLLEYLHNTKQKLNNMLGYK